MSAVPKSGVPPRVPESQQSDPEDWLREAEGFNPSIPAPKHPSLRGAGLPVPVDPEGEMRRMEARLREQHEMELRRLKENADREFSLRLKLMEEGNQRKMDLMVEKMEEIAAASAVEAARKKNKKKKEQPRKISTDEFSGAALKREKASSKRVTVNGRITREKPRKEAAPTESSSVDDDEDEEDSDGSSEYQDTTAGGAPGAPDGSPGAPSATSATTISIKDDRSSEIKLFLQGVPQELEEFLR